MWALAATVRAPLARSALRFALEVRRAVHRPPPVLGSPGAPAGPSAAAWAQLAAQAKTCEPVCERPTGTDTDPRTRKSWAQITHASPSACACLLYTSDAADE